MLNQYSWWQLFLQGGWVIVFLAILSILVFAVLFDRWGYFGRHLKRREEVWPALGGFLGGRDNLQGLEACDRNGTFLARILRAGIRAKMEKSEVTPAMEREAKLELLKFEARLPLLASIGSIAPFIGLFGTVLGIIRAFKDLAAANAGGAAVVSEGIAEALIATASGLFVAIVAVFIYNGFQAKLNQAAVEAEVVISEAAERLEN